MKRRSFVLGAAGLMLARSGFTQSDHAHHGGMYESLQKPGRIDLPPIAQTQRYFTSPAPKAANEGRWVTRAPLPLPRSEMAWATAYADRMHIVGGYAEQRVDRPYHHVYDPKTDRWLDAPPLPRGANHVGVAVLDGRLYAIGGRVDGSYGRNLGDNEAYDPATDRWEKKAPLPTVRSGIAGAVLNGRIVVIGGEAPSGTFNQTEAYDPKTDSWTSLAPTPTARHGLGAAVVGGKLYAIGGGPTPGGSNSALNEVFTP